LDGNSITYELKHFSEYLNSNGGGRRGYYFSAAFVILGSLIMILIDVHRQNLHKRKKERQNLKKLAEKNLMKSGDDDTRDLVKQPSKSNDMERKNSFTDQDDILPPVSLLSHQRSFIFDDVIDLKNLEHSIYSEEGIADMDLPDNLLLEELDYLDNITSCNKVENCVLMSEYEQNLIKETDIPSGFHNHRRSKKWSSFFKPSTLQTIHSETEDFGNVHVEVHPKVLEREMMPMKMKSTLRKFSKEPKRSYMARIEEASC